MQQKQPPKKRTEKNTALKRSIYGACWMDPTSIYLAALRHVDPVSLAHLAEWCRRVSKQSEAAQSVEPEPLTVAPQPLPRPADIQPYQSAAVQKSAAKPPAKRRKTYEEPVEDSIHHVDMFDVSGSLFSSDEVLGEFPLSERLIQPDAEPDIEGTAAEALSEAEEPATIEAEVDTQTEPAAKAHDEMNSRLAAQIVDDVLSSEDDFFMGASLDDRESEQILEIDISTDLAEPPGHLEFESASEAALVILDADEDFESDFARLHLVDSDLVAVDLESVVPEPTSVESDSLEPASFEADGEPDFATISLDWSLDAPVTDAAPNLDVRFESSDASQSGSEPLLRQSLTFDVPETVRAEPESLAVPESEAAEVEAEPEAAEVEAEPEAAEVEAEPEAAEVEAEPEAAEVEAEPEAAEVEAEPEAAEVEAEPEAAEVEAEPEAAEVEAEPEAAGSEPEVELEAEAPEAEPEAQDFAPDSDSAREEELAAQPGTELAVARPAQTEVIVADDAREDSQSGDQESDKGSIYERLTGKKMETEPEKRGSYSTTVEKQIKRDFLGVAGPSLPVEQAERRAQTAEVREMLRPDAPLLARVTRAARSLERAHKSPPMVAAALICLFGLILLIANLFVSEGFFLDGNNKFAKGDYDGAISAYDQSINLIGFRAEAYYQRGRAYNKKKKYKEAISDYTLAMRFNPGHAEAIDHRASLLVRQGDFEKANADYRRLFRIQPKPPREKLYRYTNAAIAAGQLRDWESALKYYEAALDLAPDDKGALLGRILCEGNLKHYRRAIELANELIGKNPGMLDAYLSRGWVYMAMKHNDRAAEDFQYVLKKDKNNARAYLNLGHLFWQQGRFSDAINQYELSVARDPNLMEARSARAWALLHRKPDKALADMNVLSKIPSYQASVTLLKARAQIELRQQKYGQAVSSFEKALAVTNDDTELLIGAASSYAGLRQYEKALKYADKAVALNPFLAISYAVRGTIHERMGNHISAVADFTEALKRDPKSPEALLWRAQFYVQQNRFYNAQSDLNELLKVKPSSEEGRRLLTMVNAKIPRLTNTIPAAPGNKYAAVPFEELVSKGYAELQAKRYDTATKMLSEAVRKQPGDTTARRYLAYASLRSEPSTALQQFELLKGSGAYSQDDERGHAQALSLAACGNLGESGPVQNAFAVVEKDPNNLNACYKLAKLYAAAKMPMRASIYCQRGLENSKSRSDVDKFRTLMNKYIRNQQSAPTWGDRGLGG